MRLSLAILLILFGLRFPAGAEPLRVSAAEDAVTLRMADGRIVLLDGLLAPNPDDDGGPRLWESNGKQGASYEVTAERVVFLSGAVQTAQEEQF